MNQTSRMPRHVARHLIVFAVTLSTVGGFGIILREDLSRFFYLDQRLQLLISGMLAIFGAMTFLFLYLRGDLLIPAIERMTGPDQPGIEIRDLEDAYQRLEAKLRASMHEQRAQLVEINTRLASHSPDEKSNSIDMDALVNAVREHVNGTLASEIEANVESRVLKDVVWRETRQVFESATTRLKEEIISLTRRANVNLLIGVATTIMAVSLLVYMVLAATPTFSTWPDLLSHYIPRISTVIFIEVFSFFFLRLYKASLAEVKHYQRELTSLDSCRIALAASRGASDPKSLGTVIGELARFHRDSENSPPTLTADSGQLKEMVDLVERLAKGKRPGIPSRFPNDLRA